MYIKTLALLLTCLFVTSAKAQPAGAVIIDACKTSDISLAENMHVVLVQVPSGQPMQLPDQQDLSDIELTTKGASLRIESGPGAKDKVIYVLVETLKSLTVGSNSLVQTDGILSAKQIDVYVDEDAKAIIRTKGKVRAFGISPYDVDVRSSPIKAEAATTSKKESDRRSTKIFTAVSR